MSVQEAGSKVARELHDVFSQELAALGMEVSILLNSSEIASPLTQRLADLGKKIGHLADEIHRTSRQLHPTILHELGLEAALREECNTFSPTIRHSGAILVRRTVGFVCRRRCRCVCTGLRRKASGTSANTPEQPRLAYSCEGRAEVLASRRGHRRRF